MRGTGLFSFSFFIIIYSSLKSIFCIILAFDYCLFINCKI